MSMKIECSTCRFMQTDAGDNSCLRNPPSVTLVPTPIRHPITGETGVSLQNYSAWPIVQLTQWCGQWESSIGGKVGSVPIKKSLIEVSHG